MVRDYIRFIKRLIPQGDLTSQTVKSGAWAGLTNVVDKLFRLVNLIVLANLLDPRDFGLMGIALVTMAALEKSSQLGIERALIQREEANVDRYLDTAWTVQVLRGVVLFAIGFSVAPAAAAFFDAPRSADVIRVASVSPLLFSLRNPAVLYLQKELEFHKQFVYQVSQSVSLVVVSVGVALLVRSVWALVFGLLTSRIVGTLVSYTVKTYRPSVEVNVARSKDLLNYGKWIFLSNVLIFLLNQGDDALVGWMLGAGMLGFYQVAFQVANAPATEVTHTVSKVMFPVYSQIQDDYERLRDGFFKTLQIVSLLSFPMAFGIIAVAAPFVRIFLGTQWLPTVSVIQVLSIGVLISAVGSCSGPLFLAMNKPDYETKFHIVKVLLLAPIIYPATARYGLEGTALAVIVASLAVQPISLVLAVRTIDGRVGLLLKTISVPMVASAVMGLTVVFVRENLSTGIVEFVALVVLGALVYTALILVTDRFVEFGAVDLFKRILTSLT